MATAIADIRAAMVTALETVGNLNVYRFPPKAAVPPFAFPVAEQVNYDASYARGLDEFTFAVYVATGAQMPEDVQDDFDLWADGDTFKAVLEAIDTFAIRVTAAEFTSIALAASDYAAVKFTVSVTA